MNTLRLLPLLSFAAAAAAQGPDLLLTFSQPELTLSGTGGTVLQFLNPNEVASLGFSSTPCPVSAEKWSPLTCYQTMAGDEDGDGMFWNPALFGTIDALHVGSPASTVSGFANARETFWSVSAPMGNNVSVPPFRPGDVARIIRNTLGDGQVQHFMRQEQFNMALGLPLATPIDVDAIAFHTNFGVYFSLDQDIFCPLLCGGTFVRDGDILCVPPGALTLTPDVRIATVVPASASVAYNEAQVDFMVIAAGVTDRFGICIPNSTDLEALEMDFTGPVTPIPTCTGVVLFAPTLLFATETMTGGSLLTTLGGGTIYNSPCGPVGTSCGFGPTFGNQVGIQPAGAIGAKSHVNALASTITLVNVVEPKQHVMNVFPFGAPFGANQIDYATPFALNVALIELVGPPVPGSFPAFPFSPLCFPDLYAPSILIYAWLPGPVGTYPLIAIPTFWSGKILFQNVGIVAGGYELSTPCVIEVQ